MSPRRGGLPASGPGERAGEDAAGRGARDQVEELGDPAARAALDLGEHERGDQPADAAAVDREDLDLAEATVSQPRLAHTSIVAAARFIV